MTLVNLIPHERGFPNLGKPQPRIPYCTYCMDYCCPSHTGKMVPAVTKYHNMPVCELHKNGNRVSSCYEIWCRQKGDE